MNEVRSKINDIRYNIRILSKKVNYIISFLNKLYPENDKIKHLIMEEINDSNN